MLGSSTTSLSPGLLALIPDGAIAGIDELHALGDDKVFTALNEAMEAGEVHVNMQMKGTIRTPTPILCCSNPRGGDNTRFDMAPDAEPFLEQAKFPGAFTSRFDFIFGFFDVVDSELDGAIFAGMAGAMNVEENDPYAAFPIPDGYKKYLQLARDTVAAEVIWPNDVIEHAKQINHKARQNSVGGARVSKRWGATLLRASNAVARLDLSSTVTKKHIDFAYSILAESLTTKEPGMVGEATSGLSLAQSVVYDEVERLLTDWAIYESWERKTWARRTTLTTTSTRIGTWTSLITRNQRSKTSTRCWTTSNLTTRSNAVVKTSESRDCEAFIDYEPQWL